MKERFVVFLDGERLECNSLSEMIAKARVLGYEFKRTRRGSQIYYGVERMRPAITSDWITHG